MHGVNEDFLKIIRKLTGVMQIVIPGASIGSEGSFVSFMKICRSINFLYEGQPKTLTNAMNKPKTIKGCALTKNFTNHMTKEGKGTGSQATL